MFMLLLSLFVVLTAGIVVVVVQLAKGVNGDAFDSQSPDTNNNEHMNWL